MGSLLANDELQLLKAILMTLSYSKFLDISLSLICQTWKLDETWTTMKHLKVARL